LCGMRAIVHRRYGCSRAPLDPRASGKFLHTAPARRRRFFISSCHIPLPLLVFRALPPPHSYHIRPAILLFTRTSRSATQNPSSPVVKAPRSRRLLSPLARDVNSPRYMVRSVSRPLCMRRRLTEAIRAAASCITYPARTGNPTPQMRHLARGPPGGATLSYRCGQVQLPAAGAEADGGGASCPRFRLEEAPKTCLAWSKSAFAAFLGRQRH
jgi:hypothetical protein